jgi:hypothetical protein
MSVILFFKGYPLSNFRRKLYYIGLLQESFDKIWGDNQGKKKFHMKEHLAYRLIMDYDQQP